MTNKKAWKDWAIGFIKSTGKCPGEVPAVGMPEDLMTESEFKQSIGSGGVHKYDGCHFLDSMLGGEVNSLLMNPVKVDDEKVEKNVKELEPVILEVGDSKVIAQIKEKLHGYVDKIELKPGRVLFVPEPLLKIKDYLAKFFSI